MPRKKQPKFKVGDVVETKTGLRGVLIEQYAKNSSEGAFLFKVEWFNLDGQQFGILTAARFRIPIEAIGMFRLCDLMLCKGMNDTKLCDPCKHRFQCWTNRR